MATNRPGVFAGGDVAPGDRSVTAAIGHGHRAAAGITAWLAGETLAAPAEPDLAPYDALNTWYFEDAPRQHRPRLEMVRRQSSFDEVVQDLDEGTALYEARRCLSCGGCISCDNCYAFCPDNAVIKLGPRASTPSTSTTARAAACASRSARPARCSCSPKRYDLHASSCPRVGAPLQSLRGPRWLERPAAHAGAPAGRVAGHPGSAARPP